MKVLIITANFAEPENPSSQHLDNRLPDLLSRGVTATVVTEEKPRRQPLSTTPCLIPHTVPVPISRWQRTWREINTFHRRVTTKLSIPPWREFYKDRFAHWAWRATAVDSILQKLPLHEYDLIFSAGGPAVAHLVAHDIAQKTQKRWVAEIQDPLIFPEVATVYHASRNDLKHLHEAEACLLKADLLICLTQACLEDYKSRVGIKHGVSLYPWIGQNTSHIRVPRVATGRMHLIHAGTLAYTRNLHALIGVIEAAGMEDCFSLSLYGNLDEANREFIAQHAKLCTHYELIPREALGMKLARADAACIIQHCSPVSQTTIPSKLYEYASAQVPILYLGYENNEARDLSDRYQFYYADQHTPAELAQVLRRVYDDWTQGQLLQPRAESLESVNDRLYTYLRGL